VQEVQKHIISEDFFANPMSFEAELVKIYTHIKDLKESLKYDDGIQNKVNLLEDDLLKRVHDMYKNLSPIQRVEIARHPRRPHGLDYINRICEDFFELCGDRLFGEDKAIIAGLGKINGNLVMIIAHEKGHDIDSRRIHNFGMPMPEGYRKAKRLMYIAQQIKVPIICLIDTPGAYPGITSEERGQGAALADSIAALTEVEVPVFSCIIGEGGSGGAVALAVANKVVMLENSIYSVISPEGCASILWKAKDKRAEAAIAQKLTAQDLIHYKLIDNIVKEPFGGAHRDPDTTISNLYNEIKAFLDEYSNKDMYYFYLRERVDKYKKITSLI
jgi:acetyl-CoA carboxylase carboxyl transferase subunit alpha